MREAVIVADAHGAHAWEVGREPTILVLERGVTAAEQHEAQLLFAQETREHGRGEVEAFLLPQARDHAHQRKFVIGRQVEFAQERGLALGLAGGLGRGERLREMLVGGRIPFVAVDAVQDAAERAGASAHDFVEAVAEGRREDLLRVGRADGDDLVGMQDAAFEEVDSAQAFELLWAPEEFR